jgi:alpha-beta hydrolase superfamily lysophospholipase
VLYYYLTNTVKGEINACKQPYIWYNFYSTDKGVFTHMNKKVVLIHGFTKNHRDMQPLAKNLEKLGYESILVDLPLTFQLLEHGASLLEDILANRLLNLKAGEKIHLVGHSTGGLIIRSWLATTKYQSKVDKCVLVGTPNHGSELADIAGKYLPILPAICQTLKSLQSRYVRQIPTPSQLPVEMGAIAGNRNNLLLGGLLKGENDGRVTVKSVRITGLKDFIIMPLGHMEIHQKFETCQLVDRFLQRGKFT